MAELKPLPNGNVPDDHDGTIAFTPVIKEDAKGHWHLLIVIDVVDRNGIYESKRAAQLECPLSFDSFEKGSNHYQTYTRPSMDVTFERVRGEGGNLQDFLDVVSTDLESIETLLTMETPPEAS